MKPIVWLTKGSNFPPTLIGNKAYNLQRLNSFDFQIPKTFCICSNVLSQPPPHFWKSLEKNYQTLVKSSGIPRVALRSSTLLEDSANYSYAGIFDSYLNIDSFDNLKRKIAECWAKYPKKTEQPLALIVQEMIPAEHAGVLFTKNPLDGKSEILIEVTKGLANKLLAGKINPLQVKIYKNKVRENKTELGDKVSKVLAKEAEKIVKVFNIDQDIEWAIYKEKTYILQSRPITTLNTPIWSRKPLDERFPDALKPLDWSHQIDWQLQNAYLTLLKGLGIKDISPKLFSAKNGYLHINLADLKKLPVANIVEIVAHNKVNITFKSRLKALPLVLRIFLMAFTRSTKWSRQLADFQRQLPAKELDINSRLSRLKEASLTISQYHLVTIFLIQIFFTLLTKIGAQERPCPKRFNKTLETKKDLHTLAKTFKSNSRLSALFEQNANARLILDEINKDEVCSSSFRNFLKKNGHRANCYALSYPRWNEEPSFVIDMLRSLFLGRDQPTSKKGKNQTLIQRFIAKLYYKFVDIRENENFYMLENNYMLKKLLLELAQEWQKQEIFRNTDGIYFLTINEIEQLVEGNKINCSLKKLITKRRGEHQKNLKSQSFFSRNLKKKITGLPVSAGKARGKAVVFNGKIKKVGRQDIVVAKTLNSSMVSILKQAGGIITEFGGMLSHGAILCREMSVPAISMVDNAASCVKEGQRIFVDADKGEIILYKR